MAWRFWCDNFRIVLLRPKFEIINVFWYSKKAKSIKSRKEQIITAKKLKIFQRTTPYHLMGRIGGHGKRIKRKSKLHSHKSDSISIRNRPSFRNRVTFINLFFFSPTVIENGTSSSLACFECTNEYDSKENACVRVCTFKTINKKD